MDSGSRRCIGGNPRTYCRSGQRPFDLAPSEFTQVHKPRICSAR